MQLALQRQHLSFYSQLMRLDKPIGIYLLLWPTLWALVLAADGIPPLGISLVFIAGVVVMRSAGCVINDYADRNFDGQVKRTRLRPLATGKVSVTEALQLFALLIAIAFVLVLMLNWQTIALSLGALALAASYPFMKRYTHLPQAVLGAAYSWAIPMAVMAVTGSVPTWGWLLFFANLLWTIAYDTMYAMVDRDDDLEVGIKSTAILFGRYDKLIIGLLQLVVLALLAVVLMLKQSGTFAYLGIIAMAGFFVYEHYLIRHRQRELCFRAFLNSHWAGLAMLVGLLVDII